MNNPQYTTLKNDIYAVTQHHYLNDKYGVQTIITNNATAKVAIAEGIQYPIDKQSDYDLVPSQYKIWYTEYGEVKAIADETWVSAVRYAALVYSWISMGDKVGQLDYHYISDNNVVQIGTPMKLAPIGIAAKLVSKATANMTEMQQLIFDNNPVSVNNVLSLYGYKFKNNDKETLLIINTNSANFSDVQFSNLITYTGQPVMTQYYATQPYVSGVAEGDPNIISIIDSNVASVFNVNPFSISVIEVPNTTLGVTNEISTQTNVYPNPVTNVLYIQSKNKVNSISIYSLNGTLVFQNDNISDPAINLCNFKAGLYILKIKTDRGILFKKILKAYYAQPTYFFR